MNLIGNQAQLSFASNVHEFHKKIPRVVSFKATLAQTRAFVNPMLAVFLPNTYN